MHMATGAGFLGDDGAAAEFYIIGVCAEREQRF
jgi:predicted DNA repair protein MutK